MSSGKTPAPSSPVLDRAAKQLKQLQRLTKNNVGSPKPAIVNTNIVKLEWTDAIVTKEEVLVTYLNFLRGLPKFVLREQDKIIQTVKDKLKISEIELSLNSLNFEKLLHIEEGGYLIDKLSANLGQSLR